MSDPFLEPLDALADLMEQRVHSIYRSASQRAEPCRSCRRPERSGVSEDLLGDQSAYDREDPVRVPEVSPLARQALHYWKRLHGEQRGLLLIPGGNAGEDAIYLAQAGFDVTVVDPSGDVLERLEVLAREAHVGLTSVQCHLEVYRFPVPVSFVHTYNVLQSLGERCVPYLQRLQFGTSAGGMHSISVYIREATPAQAGGYCIERNELKFLYRGWRLLLYTEQTLWDDATQQELSLAQIIAVKPG